MDRRQQKHRREIDLFRELALAKLRHFADTGDDSGLAQAARDLIEAEDREAEAAQERTVA